MLPGALTLKENILDGYVMDADSWGEAIAPWLEVETF